MTTPLRKGWCPGALRPMAAKDGLLVRLRVTGGILSAATAHALSDLAARHGNDVFDLSSRGNLQMRGIRTDAVRTLQDGLQALGLLDANAGAEAVRNVIASPLAGLHGGLDVRPLTAALEARLAADPALHALPGKFGFLIDDGSWPTMADVDADVRFDWTGKAFSIGLAGTRHDAVRIGQCEPGGLVGEAVRIAAAFLDLSGDKPNVRRLRHLDVEALTDAFTAPPSPACGTKCRDTVEADEGGVRVSRIREKKGAAAIVGWHTYRGAENISCFGLAAPFGRLDAAMLRAAAGAALSTEHDELRLTPFRTLLVPGMTEAHDIPGFITDPADPRLGVAACVGAAGCARGTTDTHADAAALADALPNRGRIALHVSGCEKGCARPSPTPVTLVARGGRYDLVRHGRAGDQPLWCGLDLADCRELLRRSA